MKIFTKPENLNGTELMAELAKVGIAVDKVFDFANGTIGFETDNESVAAAVVAVHNGTTVIPEPTIADKLASVGLSLDELKAAILGGN
jgi:hypothetical protein